jgi:predicted AAA+ superfamily ATPase
MDRFWENENWEQEDRHLQLLSDSPFLRPFPDISFQKGIYIIRGPRQVGKSSWLKVLLSQFLEKQKSCFFASCENIRDQVELAALLKSIRGTECVLLDEISFVKDWAKAVKYEADLNFLNTLIVTGSNAYDLRRGGERLPGRMGAGLEIDLLPMDFQEFQFMRSSAGWKTLDRLEALRCFFRVGGFPGAVKEAGEECLEPVHARDIYQKWIVGDAVNAGRSEQYLREIMGQIALTTTSTISLQKLAQRTQIGSHHTAQEYVSLLEDCYALNTLYAIDPDDQSYRFRKEKKFYFRDPLLFWIALEWSGLSIPVDAEARIAEQVAATALLKRFSRIGYFSSRKGEIDFYKPHQWALEVKWSSSAKNLSKAYLDCKLPEKIVWTSRNFLEEWPHSSG